VDVAPVVDENVPLTQLIQLVAAVDTEYMPIPQEVQELDAAAEYMPTAQTLHPAAPTFV
jgi:hypothetical protein